MSSHSYIQKRQSIDSELIGADLEESLSEKPKHRTRYSSFDLPNSTDIILEGWMSIQSATKQWKKRWFALFQNNSLVYYEKTDEKQDKIGTISLYELSKVKTKQIGNGYKIELMANSKTVAMLRIENKVDFIPWSKYLESRVNPTAIYEGFAEKKSGKSGWKKRYFKLLSFGGTHSELRYYEEAKMSKIKKFKVCCCVLVCMCTCASVIGNDRFGKSVKRQNVGRA